MEKLEFEREKAKLEQTIVMVKQILQDEIFDSNEDSIIKYLSAIIVDK